MKDLLMGIGLGVGIIMLVPLLIKLLQLWITFLGL
jgi:hypothetical protein